MDRINELLTKYNNGTATQAERDELTQWYRAKGYEDGIYPDNEEEVGQRMFARLENEIFPQRRIKLWPRIAAAAAILIVVTTGYLLFRQKNETAPQQTAQNDVQPFTGQAILRSSRGTVVLDKATGQINAAVTKTANDGITYSQSENKAPETIWDTLEVTAGGRPYHLNLADGSSIIANVATKIRYPENFRNGESKIELIEGEAFFDIKHDLSRPVAIAAKGQLVSDIGTQLNINSYDETSTTLVEGELSVNKRVLAVGQQFKGNAVGAANLKQVLAWKEGYFRFNGEQIGAVMNELARWYAVEVRYEGKVPAFGFFFKISRDRKISSVLKMLEGMDKRLRFKIEGRRVTVIGRP